MSQTCTAPSESVKPSFSRWVGDGCQDSERTRIEGSETGRVLLWVRGVEVEVGLKL